MDILGTFNRFAYPPHNIEPKILWGRYPSCWAGEQTATAGRKYPGYKVTGFRGHPQTIYEGDEKSRLANHIFCLCPLGISLRKLIRSIIQNLQQDYRYRFGPTKIVITRISNRSRKFFCAPDILQVTKIKPRLANPQL